MIDNNLSRYIFYAMKMDIKKMIIFNYIRNIF